MSYQELLARAAELRDRIAETQAEIDSVDEYNRKCRDDDCLLDNTYEIHLLHCYEEELEDVEDEIYRMVGC